MAAAGDVDGDGHDDVLVGSRFEDEGDTNAGAAYLLLGPLSGTSDLSGADGKLIGDDSGDMAGGAMASGGDIDQDGYGDLIVGAAGRSSAGSDTGAVYIMLGPVSGTVQLSGSYLCLEGENSGDKVGYAVAGGYDLDGDPVNDVVVGAPYEDSGGTSGGAVMVFSGNGL